MVERFIFEEIRDIALRSKIEVHYTRNSVLRYISHSIHNNKADAVIGLNSDSSVKKLKGETRPIQNEKSRALILSAFQFVDFVVIFDEETPFNLISKIQPNLNKFKENQKTSGNFL